MNGNHQALWVASSLFSAAGVVAAAAAWSALLDRRFARLLWLVPALLLAAWLETSLNGAPYPHMAVDVVGFTAVAGACVFLRRMVSPRKVVQANESQPEPSRVDTAVIADPELRVAVTTLLSAADKADSDTMAGVYDPAFICLRVADNGPSAHLNREQMLAFFATRGQRRQPGAARSHPHPPNYRSPCRDRWRHGVRVDDAREGPGEWLGAHVLYPRLEKAGK